MLYVSFQDVYFEAWLQAMPTKHMRHIRYWKSCIHSSIEAPGVWKCFVGGEKTGKEEEEERKQGKTQENTCRCRSTCHLPFQLMRNIEHLWWKHEVSTRASPDSILLKVSDTGWIFPDIKVSKNDFQTPWWHVKLVHLVVLFYRKHVNVGVKSPPKEW